MFDEPEPYVYKMSYGQCTFRCVLIATVGELGTTMGKEALVKLAKKKSYSLLKSILPGAGWFSTGVTAFSVVNCFLIECEECEN
ncbi:MAG: hypothetical protein GY705_06465 [Bacteroidetes bacterium]|nr:hypothetical protein [Bacteroidota bacterium]